VSSSDTEVLDLVFDTGSGELTIQCAVPGEQVTARPVPNDLAMLLGIVLAGILGCTGVGLLIVWVTLRSSRQARTTPALASGDTYRAVSVQDQSRGPVEQLRLRPFVFGMTLLGVLATLLSLASMSWYSIDGRHVITDPSEGLTDTFLINPDVGSHHSWLTWTVFVLCAVAAVLAGIPRTWVPRGMRFVAPVLASLLGLGAIARVVKLELAPYLLDFSDVQVSIERGFWVTLAGLVLIAVGAAIGVRRTVTTG
jgi:hypothetical protein